MLNVPEVQGGTRGRCCKVSGEDTEIVRLDIWAMGQGQKVGASTDMLLLTFRHFTLFQEIIARIFGPLSDEKLTSIFNIMHPICSYLNSNFNKSLSRIYLIKSVLCQIYTTCR